MVFSGLINKNINSAARVLSKTKKMYLFLFVIEWIFVIHKTLNCFKVVVKSTFLSCLLNMNLCTPHRSSETQPGPELNKVVKPEMPAIS